MYAYTVSRGLKYDEPVSVSRYNTSATANGLAMPTPGYQYNHNVAALSLTELTLSTIDKLIDRAYTELEMDHYSVACLQRLAYECQKGELQPSHMGSGTCDRCGSEDGTKVRARLAHSKQSGVL